MNENKRIAINSIIIFIRLCIVSLVSIIISRVVLDALGASDYGLYNVVGGLVMLLNVINMAMSSATYRFITTEMGKGNNGNINKVFNTSLAIHFLFAFFIVLLGLTLGEWYVNCGLNVPVESMRDARVVYHITIFTTFVCTLLVPYNGMLIACENFKFTAITEIIVNLFKLTAVLTILFHVPNRLICYSIIMSATTIFQWLVYVAYSTKNYKSYVRIHFSRDKQLYREMLGYSGWTALGSFTNVGKTQIVAVLINYFFGTIVNAAFAVANQINNFIVMFASSLNTAAVPQITKSLSAGNANRSFNLAARISKYTFFLMLVVSFPVLMEIDFLLDLWLKEVPEGANIFCVLIVVAGLFTCVCQGTQSLVNASGKIKWFQVIGNTYVLLSLPVGWLCFYLGANAYALSFVICIFMFFNIPLNLVLLKRVLDFDIRNFFKISYWPMLKVFIPLVVIYIFYNPNSFSLMGHILGLGISMLLVLVLIATVGIDQKEKTIIREKIGSIKCSK